MGKTRVSLLLAEIFNTNIISCDARQFYKDIKIGTSCPDKQSLDRIQHHFIGNLSLWQTYSVGDYKKDAVKKLNELFTRLPIIFMTGGSGLYGKVIVSGINYLPIISKEISRDLYIKMILQKEIDKKNYILFENNNYYRFFRLLDVMKNSNRSFFSFHKKIIIDHYFYIFYIALNIPKYVLRENINKRIESMIDCGFIEEAQECYSYRYLNALQTIGYKDIINYFDGKISFDKAIKEIKKKHKTLC